MTKGDTLPRMNLTFLGTSNAVPRADRGQTCIHLEADGLGHILDCGDGASTKLLLNPSLDWGTFRAILVTHLHPDHAAGLFIFLHLLHMKAIENSEWSICRGELFHLCLPESEGSQRIVDSLPAFHIGPERLAFDLAIDFYQTGRPFEAGALTVEPWPTSHADEAHGFTISAEGKRVVFSGDLGDPEEITEPARGADLVITEAAHFHPRELVAALTETGAKHIVVTHMHDVLMDRPDRAEELFAPFAENGMLTFAHDGLVVQI